MKITRTNLHQAIVALRKCSEQNKNKEIMTGHIVVSSLCDDVADYLEQSTTAPNVEELAEKYAESCAKVNNLPIEIQHLLETAYIAGVNRV